MYSNSSNGSANGATEVRRNPILEDDMCLVCGAETSGLHFQVNVCRACAAFFRRSVKAKKVYRCRRGTRNCELTKITNGRPICRFCRLQKCYQVGMRYDANEKDDRKSPDPSAARRVPTYSTSEDSPTEGFQNMSSPDDYEPNIGTHGGEYRDPNGESHFQRVHAFSRSIYPIVEQTKQILSQDWPPPMYTAPQGVHMTPLQQLQYGFARFLEIVRPDNESIQVVEVADKLESFKFQEEYCLTVAELAMCCEPFAKLPFMDKWLLFRHFWCAFYSLERCYSSVEVFGYDLEDSTHLVTSKFASNDNTQWEIVGIPPERSAEFIKFCRPLKENMWKNIKNPMKLLKITRFEVVYMMAQLLWSVYEVKGISEHAKTAGENVLEQISSELHNFYMFDMHLPNYASRHAKIIRLLSVAEHQVQLYKDYMTMAKIFNIFEYDLYESELIE